MSQQRIAQALDLLQRFPENDLARFSLAQAYFATEEYRTAAEHLRVLCTKKPDWMVAHIMLGKCLLASGQADEAKQLFTHAHQLAVTQHHDGPRAELEDLLRML